MMGTMQTDLEVDAGDVVRRLTAEIAALAQRAVLAEAQVAALLAKAQDGGAADG